MDPEFQERVLQGVHDALLDELLAEQPVNEIKVVTPGKKDEPFEPYLLVTQDNRILRLTVSFEAVIPGT